MRKSWTESSASVLFSIPPIGSPFKPMLPLSNGKKVFPESEKYEECLFGYSRIVHTDTRTFTMGINLVQDKGPRD